MPPREENVSVPFSARLADASLPSGLTALAESHRFAVVADCDPWEFATEIATLVAMGISASELRLLVHEGYLDHAREVTRNCDARRRFQPIANLSFPPRTCFVLTDAGLRRVRELKLDSVATLLSQERQAALPSADCPQDMLPVWCARKRILVLNDRVVLRYTYRSPNQELVLKVFHEEGWPARIDDPLPFVPGLDAKQRIRDTVRALNAKQGEHLIHFRSDGSGQSVLWQSVSAARASPVLAVLPRRRAA
jgi:hypothetical protein